MMPVVEESRSAIRWQGVGASGAPERDDASHASAQSDSIRCCAAGGDESGRTWRSGTGQPADAAIADERAGQRADNCGFCADHGPFCADHRGYRADHRRFRTGYGAGASPGPGAAPARGGHGG